MELFWELVFVGTAAGFVWIWWRAGQTGIIKCRGGNTIVRERHPFFFALIRTFVLTLGLTMFTVIPFMSGMRSIFGY